jgi:cellulose synthase/poly-beta-1,6-N-acetylglucosamine synthase-like glycosyltransferase
MILVHLLTILIFIYLVSTIPYLLVLAIAGRFGRISRWSTHPVKARIGVFIPSYREDSVILDTAAHAITQSYPDFTVIVIADQLAPETISVLKNMPIRLVQVQWEKSTKAKSLNAALSASPAGAFDLALILDADNLMAPGCLEKINHAFQSGRRAIQCHRTAKNKNSAVAVLDALSEEINNTIFRRGQRVLGLSCSLIGSGMAFDFGLLKDIFALPSIQDNPGEDKEVEIQLIRRGIPVEYLEDAYVYDEKVQKKEVFERQRTRWLATQHENFRHLLSGEMRPALRNPVYWHKVWDYLLLPRLFLMILFAGILILCAIDARNSLHLFLPAWPWWAAMAAAYALALVVAAPSSFYNRTTGKALLQVPVLMFSMLRALFAMKKNKSGFIHTPKEFSNR